MLSIKISTKSTNTISNHVMLFSNGIIWLHNVFVDNESAVYGIPGELDILKYCSADVLDFLIHHFNFHMSLY